MRGGFLAVRALLALGLMAGFYTLAIAVAGLLFYLPYAEVVYLHRLDIRIALAAVVTGCVILWSIVPRPDRFVEPGPELKPADQPEFFKLIDSVASRTKQRMPAHVYLVLDVNAWVTQRGGFMGLGSRRVMGVGLPLMQALTVDQLRAVLAHEFGHYHGGDTMLGPWIYKTRASIIRTIVRLQNNAAAFIFIAYAKLFLRITNAISRAQEFAADALAARVTHPVSMIEGLKRVERAAPAFRTFWTAVYAPALSYRVLPPLAGGFTNFLQHPSIAAQVDDILSKKLASSVSNAYDTHPPLAERVSALNRIAAPGNSGQAADERPAAELLNDGPRLEGELLHFVVPKLSSAKPVEWDDVPMQVWLPQWRKLVDTQRAALSGITVGGLAEAVNRAGEIGRRIQFNAGYLPSIEQRQTQTYILLARALAVALCNAGWTLCGGLNELPQVRRDEESINIMNTVGELRKRTISPAAWVERCERLGISALPLVAPAAESTSASA